jgi:glutamate-1-semialdehyde 2,1-aminomutase
MAAGVTTMQMLERDDGAVYRQIDSLQGLFMQEFQQLAHRHGHAMLIQGVRGVFCAHFTELPAAYTPAELAAHADRQKAARFRLALIDEGVYPGRGDRYFVGAGLTEDDLADGLRRIDRALARM